MTKQGHLKFKTLQINLQISKNQSDQKNNKKFNFFYQCFIYETIFEKIKIDTNIKSIDEFYD